MSKIRKIAFAVLAAACLLCLTFAAACAGGVTKYTVTFMDGETEYRVIEVEKGARIGEYPEAPPRSDENYLFDGWYKDEELKTVWKDEVERVNGNIKLYAKFLYVSADPTNGAMESVAFSNTLTWLQRGEVGEYTVKLFKGRKISESGYAYETSGTDLAGTATSENYNGINGVSLVKWTAAAKPVGGVYAAEVSHANGTARFEGLFFKGAGEQNNPYLISDGRDFAAVNTVDVAGGAYYKVYNDLTVRCSASEISGHTFGGTLDGNGRTVTLEGSNCGLFGKLANTAVIEELKVDGAILNAVDCAGVIAGENFGRISFCTVGADITSDRGEVNVYDGSTDGMTGGAGGFAGVNNGVINHSEYSGTVKARVGGGGFAAINNGTLEHCTNRGTLGAANAIESGDSTKAFSYAGGIAGVNYGTVTCSSTTGSGKLLAQRSMKGSGYNDNIGGVVGANMTGATVTHCFFDGTRVYGNKNVGGIAGLNEGVISYSFAAAAYRSSLNIKDGEETVYLGHSYIGGSDNVGGIAGNGNGTVKNCFVTANVYAYGGTVYKVAKTAENSVYLGGNLSPREFTVISGNERKPSATSDFAEVAGNGNVTVAVAEEDKAASTYKLKEDYLPTLNAGEEAFAVRSGAIRLACEADTQVKEHFIIVTVNGAGGNEFTLSSNDGVKYTPLADDKEGAFVSGFALIEGGESTFEYGISLGYDDLEPYATDGKVVLYPVYTEGARPQSTVLNVAVWTRYVDEQTVSALLAEFENYSGYRDGWSVKYKTLSSRNNDTFVKDFGLGNDGRYNVGFGYKSTAVNFGQSTVVTVRMRNANDGNAYDNLRVGLTGADDIITEFGKFLATDAAKKIMCPDYVSVTFNVGGEISGALALDGEPFAFPAPEAPEGSVFAGWALTAEEAEGETLYTGSADYATLAELAKDKELALYARFKVGEDPEVKVLRVVFYGKFCIDGMPGELETALKAYLDANGVDYTAVDFVVSTANKNDVLNEELAGLKFDSVFNLGGSKPSLAQADGDHTLSITLKYLNTSGVETVGNRDVTFANDDEVTVAWKAFLQTDGAKNILNPQTPDPDPEPDPDPTDKPALKVAVYKKFIDQEVATALETGFETYCAANDIAYESITVTLMTTGKGEVFTEDAKNCDVALGHKGGTAFVSKETVTVAMMMNAANGGEVAIDRKAERLTDNALAVKFMEFLATDEGKAALVTPTQA